MTRDKTKHIIATKGDIQLVYCVGVYNLNHKKGLDSVYVSDGLGNTYSTNGQRLSLEQAAQIILHEEFDLDSEVIERSGSSIIRIVNSIKANIYVPRRTREIKKSGSDITRMLRLKCSLSSGHEILLEEEGDGLILRIHNGIDIRSIYLLKEEVNPIIELLMEVS
jgi:hypothetical protein